MSSVLIPSPYVCNLHRKAAADMFGQHPSYTQDCIRLHQHAFKFYYGMSSFKTSYCFPNPETA